LTSGQTLASFFEAFEFSLNLFGQTHLRTFNKDSKNSESLSIMMKIKTMRTVNGRKRKVFCIRKLRK